MQPGLRVAIDENQTEISAPNARLERLAYAWVVNGSGADAYISVWSGTGTSRTVAQRVAGPFLVPAAHAAPVLLELQTVGGAAVVAAHTAANLTGSPSSALEFVPFWSA